MTRRIQPRPQSLILFIGITFLVFANGCVILPLPYKGYPYEQILGRIIDQNTHQPIENAEIGLRYLVPAFPAPRIWIHPGKSDKDGLFIIDPRRRWTMITVNIFSSGYDSLGIRKDGYKDILIHMKIDDQRIFMGNYGIVKKKYDLGDIKMIPSGNLKNGKNEVIQFFSDDGLNVEPCQGSWRYRLGQIRAHAW